MIVLRWIHSTVMSVSGIFRIVWCWFCTQCLTLYVLGVERKAAAAQRGVESSSTYFFEGGWAFRGRYVVKLGLALFQAKQKVHGLRHVGGLPRTKLGVRHQRGGPRDFPAVRRLDQATSSPSSVFLFILLIRISRKRVARFSHRLRYTNELWF